MKNFLRTIIRTGLGLIYVMSTPTLCPAQVQYATSVVTAQNAGFVVDDYKAADGDLATNATIAPAVLLGFTRLRVSFAQTAQANKPAGFYLQPHNPLLNIALLAGGTLNTYMQTGNTTTAVESFALSSNLLSLSLLTSGVSKATFNPTQPFNQVEIVFFSLLSLGQDISVYEAFSTPIAPLPVVLTSFKGKAVSASVVLQWETASESKSSHFVVERATEAAGTFAAIGRVQGAGSSSQPRQYRLVDSAPDLLTYYRLRQVDLDGTETFSPVIAVRSEPVGAELAAYPNPATDVLTVRGPVGTSFIILDQVGRQVHRATIAAIRLPQLDVSGWPGGVYIVQDVTGKRAKFVKSTR